MTKTSADNRAEFRKNVADQFIKVLEEGGLEWQKGWNSLTAFPFNDFTKKKYNGVNAFFLLLEGIKYNNDSRWLTFKQIMELNKKLPEEKRLSVKGEKGTKVEYWFLYDKQEKKSISYSEAKKLIDNGNKNRDDFVPVPKYYTVFNAQQIENYPEFDRTINENVLDTDYIKTLSEKMGVTILNDGKGQAYYLPSKDTIHLPERGDFHSQHDYDYTALHELAHSTGHKSRLNRNMTGVFKTEQYAYEELIAEITSCFMGANLTDNIPEEHMNNHKAYIQNWIEIIKDKPEKLVNAIAEAQKAADFMENIMDKDLDINHEVIKTTEEKLNEIEQINLEIDTDYDMSL